MLYHKQKEQEAAAWESLVGSSPPSLSAADMLRHASLAPCADASAVGDLHGAGSFAFDGGVRRSDNCLAAGGGGRGGGGGGGGGTLGMKRTKSSGDMLVGGHGGSFSFGAAAARPFDASPLEFGGSSRRAQRSPVGWPEDDTAVAPAERREPAQGVGAHDMRGAHGARSGGLQRLELDHEPIPFHAATMVASYGGASSPEGEPSSPTGVLDKGCSGGRAGAQHAQHAATLPPSALVSPSGERKEKKSGKVKFKSRLRQLLWGEEGDSMHQPLW